MKKRFFSLFLAMSLLLTGFTFNTSALSVKEHFNKIPVATIDKLGLSQAQIDKIIPLYNADDSVIAYCIEANAGGFNIVDLNGMIVTQVEEIHSPFYENTNKIYIKDPLSFYVKKGDNFINVVNEYDVLDGSDFENNVIVTVQNSLEKELSVYNATYSNNATTAAAASVTEKKLAYEPRYYSYNPSGICMGTAGAMVLAYYYDHISKSAAAPRHINSDGVGLTILLAEGSYYRYTSGSYASRAAQVLNWYFTNHTTSSYKATYTDTKANIYKTVVSQINAGKPLQAHFLIDGNPNQAHSVCVWGYATDSSNSNNNKLLVNYGWGTNRARAYVNINHVYGLIWIY